MGWSTWQHKTTTPSSFGWNWQNSDAIQYEFIWILWSGNFFAVGWQVDPYEVSPHLSQRTSSHWRSFPINTNRFRCGLAPRTRQRWSTPTSSNIQWPQTKKGGFCKTIISSDTSDMFWHVLTLDITIPTWSFLARFGLFSSSLCRRIGGEAFCFEIPGKRWSRKPSLACPLTCCFGSFDLGILKGVEHPKIGNQWLVKP